MVWFYKERNRLDLRKEHESSFGLVWFGFSQEECVTVSDNLVFACELRIGNVVETASWTLCDK